MLPALPYASDSNRRYRDSAALTPRRRFLRLRDQLFDLLVEHLIACDADVLVADDAAVVQDVQRRPALDVPLRGDGSRPAAVPEGSPGDLFLLERLLERLAVPVAVDTEQNERLAFQLLHERP